MAKRGRPPLAEGEPSTSISVRVPNSVFDRLTKHARDLGVSLPELLRRRALARRPSERDEPERRSAWRPPPTQDG